MKKQAEETESVGYAANSVNLVKDDWKLLRRVAEARAAAHGGRPSVSKVIQSLVDRYRDRLQKEAGTF